MSSERSADGVMRGRLAMVRFAMVDRCKDVQSQVLKVGTSWIVVTWQNMLNLAHLIDTMHKPCLHQNAASLVHGHPSKPASHSSMHHQTCLPSCIRSNC